MLSTLAHHGIIYVPLGVSRTFAQLRNLDEVHGGESSLVLVFGLFMPVSRTQKGHLGVRAPTPVWIRADRPPSSSLRSLTYKAKASGRQLVNTIYHRPASWELEPIIDCNYAYIIQDEQTIRWGLDKLDTHRGASQSRLGENCLFL